MDFPSKFVDANVNIFDRSQIIYNVTFEHLSTHNIDKRRVRHKL